MEILKVLLVMAAGLGSTWMAREATEAVFGVARPQFLTQAEQPPQGSAGRQGGAVAAPEPGRQKMEADLRRAQERLGMGVTSEELREFRPTRPLPADLAVELPSDI
ncbi:MAG: hypothetical protein L6Q83_10280 [Gammaproteobacteria bacterium]|jgi:hypothetical protein|nr:hypothetical protein [Gammaproteobacteria bacterium]